MLALEPPGCPQPTRNVAEVGIQGSIARQWGGVGWGGDTQVGGAQTGGRVGTAGFLLLFAKLLLLWGFRFSDCKVEAKSFTAGRAAENFDIVEPTTGSGGPGLRRQEVPDQAL